METAGFLLTYWGGFLLTNICIERCSGWPNINTQKYLRSQDELVSKISRKSINLLKEFFRDELEKDDWRLVVKLKALFHID